MPPQYEQLTDANIHEAMRVWKMSRPHRSKKYDRWLQRFGHISDWDTSRVTNMRRLISNASFFNEDIARWDTSNVTNMEGLFCCSGINADISRWDTSRVTTMRIMFNSAYYFNQDISGWDTSNVTDMDYMFTDAYRFNQDLSKWNVYNVREASHIFSDSGMKNNSFEPFFIGGERPIIYKPVFRKQRLNYIRFLHATRTNCIPDEMLREIVLYI